MSIRRPDTVNLGVPIKIPVNSQTPAYNDQKVLTGRYGTLQNYRTTDLKSAYISDWTPITLVKQTPSPPPLHKPSVPSLGVPIKTPTSNVFHARTNYKGELIYSKLNCYSMTRFLISILCDILVKIVFLHSRRYENCRWRHSW